MARVQDGGSGSGLSSRASLSPAEMNCSAQDTVELEQVIVSLDSGYTLEDSQEMIEPLWYIDVFSIDEEGNAMCSWASGPQSQGVHGKTCRKNYLGR